MNSQDDVEQHIDTLEKILDALKVTKTETSQVNQAKDSKRVLIRMKQLSAEADREVEKLNKVIKLKLKEEV